MFMIITHFNDSGLIMKPPPLVMTKKGGFFSGIIVKGREQNM